MFCTYGYIKDKEKPMIPVSRVTRQCQCAEDWQRWDEGDRQLLMKTFRSYNFPIGKSRDH